MSSLEKNFNLLDFFGKNKKSTQVKKNCLVCVLKSKK